MTKYYSTQRPIGPGTYPKPQNNKVIEIKNFDKKEKIEKEDINAYGYIKYEKPLMPAAAKTYELTLALALDETEKTIEENKETEQPNLAAKTDEEIIEAAIKKISNKEDEWNDVLKNFLLAELPKDIQLAKGVLEPLKNSKSLNNHLGKWAKEKMEKNAAAFNITNGNIRGCALTSDEVFSEVIHYFIDVKEEKQEVKPINKPTSTKPTISNRPTLTTTSVTKKEKEIIDKKRNDKYTKEINTFKEFNKQVPEVPKNFYKFINRKVMNGYALYNNKNHQAYCTTCQRKFNNIKN